MSRLVAIDGKEEHRKDLASHRMTAFERRCKDSGISVCHVREAFVEVAALYMKADDWQLTLKKAIDTIEGLKPQ